MRYKKKRYGIYDGRIVYSDIHRNEKALFSKKYELSGKPDYIVKTQSGHIIPVEVKTGWHDKPLKHHVMQLIAYCQLVEETTGNTVPYGLLIYYDTGKKFKIPFDAMHLSELERTLQQMRAILKTGEVEINHEDPQRCMHCSVRKYCHKSLA